MNAGSIIALVFCATGFWHLVDKIIERERKRKFDVEIALQDILASELEQCEHWSIIQDTLEDYSDHCIIRDIDN